MPALVRHREPAPDPILPHRFHRPLAHAQGEPIVSGAVDDEGWGLVGPRSDMVERGDALELVGGGFGEVWWLR